MTAKLGQGAEHTQEDFLRQVERFLRVEVDERIESVDWVHGSNGSVRKSVIERVGGWDARSTEHDEHPFCLPLQNQLRPGERLVFEPYSQQMYETTRAWVNARNIFPEEKKGRDIYEDAVVRVLAAE